MFTKTYASSKSIFEGGHVIVVMSILMFFFLLSFKTTLLLCLYILVIINYLENLNYEVLPLAKLGKLRLPRNF